MLPICKGIYLGLSDSTFGRFDNEVPGDLVGVANPGGLTISSPQGMTSTGPV